MNAINPDPAISPPQEEERKPRILAVDDDRMMMLILTKLLDGLEYEYLTASDGREACEIVERERTNLDAILLDREMPEMTGLEVVAHLKQDPILSRIPIIMQTGSDKPEQIKEGIDAGVFYYLTKPYDEDVLKSVLVSALRDVSQKQLLRSEMQKHKVSFDLVSSCEFSLRTLDEAENLACFLANCFPDADRVVGGLAELLINAVEHGSLGISYEEKSHLIGRGTWREEVENRQSMAAYQDRLVRISFRREDSKVSAKIRDQGPGFDWRSFLEVDPSRAMDNHGRGIAHANLHSFDELKYNDSGNEVTAIINLEEDLDW